jgi:hypothetical protein
MAPVASEMRDRRTMPLGLMRWMIRRTSLLLFSAFPLVVRHQLAFLVYQSMHMGPGVFFFSSPFAVRVRRSGIAGVSWDTNPVVWNNILEHLELCLVKDKKRWSGHTGERAVSTSLAGSRPTFNLGANV